MPNQTLSLPDAITDAASLPQALERMRQAQSALDRLSEQVTVFHLAELFEDNPELLSFSFTLSRESDDEGGSFLCPCVSATTEASLDEDDLDNLQYEIHEWVSEQTVDWKRMMKNKTIARPSASQTQTLAEALMAQCLSPRAFAAWQASCVDRAAGPATRGSHPPPSL